MLFFFFFLVLISSVITALTPFGLVFCAPSILEKQLYCCISPNIFVWPSQVPLRDSAVCCTQDATASSVALEQLYRYSGW